MGQKKVNRTKEYENAVKVGAIMDQTAEEIQKLRFDSLVKQGIIQINDGPTETISGRFPEHLRNPPRETNV